MSAVDDFAGAWPGGLEMPSNNPFFMPLLRGNLLDIISRVLVCRNKENFPG